MIKRGLFAVSGTAVWLTFIAGGALAAESNSSPLEYLAHQLEEPACKLMKDKEDAEDFYSDLINWDSGIADYPERFDLREKGLVTPVKEQAPFGTCWSFGVMAASESSILSELNITAADFEELYGEPLDLSERHLAWYMANALPDVKAFPDGEYPYEEGQAGEGLHLVTDKMKILWILAGIPFFPLPIWRPESELWERILLRMKVMKERFLTMMTGVCPRNTALRSPMN